MTLLTFSKYRRLAETDDSHYMSWVKNNPNGFVMAFTLPDEGYVTLHSAECSHISRSRSPGAYTRRNYGKHCAESWQDVEVFMARPDARVEECSRCGYLLEEARIAWKSAGGTLTSGEKSKGPTERQVSRLDEPLQFRADNSQHGSSGSQDKYNERSVGPKEIEAIANYCRSHLPLEDAKDLLGDHYQCVPVCVIDAVYSIGVKYESTEAVVRRFCRYFELPYSGPDRLPPIESQLSVEEFLNIYNKYGFNRMADEIYRNRQRTSTRSGILKSEAVLRFSRVLQKHKINYLQDVNAVIGKSSFEADIHRIPGQSSGISLRYFYMLAGADDFIKPDRMIRRFLAKATGRDLNFVDCHNAIVGAHKLLVRDHPFLTPKSLDHLIWRYERTK